MLSPRDENEILMSYHLYARKSWVRSEQVFRLLAKELYIVPYLGCKFSVFQLVILARK